MIRPTSSNPVFNTKTLNKLGSLDLAGSKEMTVSGAINKAGILLALLIAGATFGWSASEAGWGGPLIVGPLIINLILVLVLVFNKSLAPYLAPAYAILEGLCLGAISYLYNSVQTGIVFNAMILTFGTLFGMIVLYHFKVLRATENFKRVMALSMVAILCTYLVDMVMQLFGHPIGFIHSSSPTSIVFSLVIVGVAALNFILDFDMIEQAAQQRMPKWMEWYSGFALLVTLVWLYLEILRLLSKLNKR